MLFGVMSNGRRAEEWTLTTSQDLKCGSSKTTGGRGGGGCHNNLQPVYAASPMWLTGTDCLKTPPAPQSLLSTRELSTATCMSHSSSWHFSLIKANGFWKEQSPILIPFRSLRNLNLPPEHYPFTSFVMHLSVSVSDTSPVTDSLLYLPLAYGNPCSSGLFSHCICLLASQEKANFKVPISSESEACLSCLAPLRFCQAQDKGLLSCISHLKPTLPPEIKSKFHPAFYQSLFSLPPLMVPEGQASVCTGDPDAQWILELFRGSLLLC